LVIVRDTAWPMREPNAQAFGGAKTAFLFAVQSIQAETRLSGQQSSPGNGALVDVRLGLTKSFYR